eukprot:6200593-Pleurochrysis_carterae.AAC.1
MNHECDILEYCLAHAGSPYLQKLAVRFYQHGPWRHEADSERRWAVTGGTAQGAGLREGDNARRRAARAGPRKAPSCESG